MQDDLTIEELVRPLRRGSSLPWLARATDGSHHVVKFRGAGPGAVALAADLVVSRVARHWSIPVPATRPIALLTGTPRAGTDEFWDVMDASAGWNLAVEYLPSARDVALARDPLLAPATERAIVWIDTCFANYDRTILSDNLLATDDGTVWLIDHGSCLFLQRLQETAPAFELARNHILLGRDPHAALADVDPSRMEDVPLESLLADLPPEWLASLGLSPASLRAGLTARLAAFARWLGPATPARP